MVTERNHNGDSYLLIDLDLEQNKTLLHEALTWYPSCLWYQKKLFEAGLFFGIVSWLCLKAWFVSYKTDWWPFNVGTEF